MKFSRQARTATAVCLWVVGFGLAPVLKAQPTGEVARTGGTHTSSGDPGHHGMLELLGEILERSATENAYTGVDYRRRDRDQLEELPPDAPAAQRARLHLIVGKDELRLGNNATAVDHLLKAHSMAGNDLVEPAFQLAVAHMRLGEAQNCLAHRNPESCILPLRGGGIHGLQQGAREAVRYLTEVLRQQPNHLAARWLLNLNHMALGEYPDHVAPQHRIPPERFESEETVARFRDVAPDLGLNTVSLSGGAIADDFDNDGWLDIVVSDWSPGGQLRYFRNNGDGSFSERTEQAGLRGLYGGLNLIHADYDNDGDPDILVMRGAWLGQAGRYPNSLLQNDGTGRFRDVTFAAGLGNKHLPTQTAAWADYDNDGHLDLYVGNEMFPGQLFHNNGDSTFTDVARDAGVENGAVAKGVVWGDVDGDRLPDLYVSNFGSVNRLYRNNGDGTFEDIAAEANVLHPVKSFPTWFWDFNNDGNLDLFVSSYERRVEDVAAPYFGLPPLETVPDSFYQGDGTGSFRDVSLEVASAPITQPMGSNFGDFDNDGFLDFYLGTGYPEYEGLMPNLLYRSVEGQRFVDVTTSAGLGHSQKGHGVAFADFDRDGDQDILVEMGGAYSGDVFGNCLFENPGFGNRWLVVKLVGGSSARSAIGARIRATILENGRERSIYRWVGTGGSFGASPMRQHIGLGQAQQVISLAVYWPTSDTTQVFESVNPDQFIVVHEGRSNYETVPYRPVKFRRASTSAHPTGPPTVSSPE